MHQTQKGNQWRFGMKVHVAVDADSGQVRPVTATPANEADIEQIADLLHGKEQQVWAGSGYGRPRCALTARICNGPSLLARATSPSCPKGSVRQRLVPRVGQEHRARDAAVRTVGPVVGGAIVDGNGGSLPAKRMNDVPRDEGR